MIRFSLFESSVKTEAEVISLQSFDDFVTLLQDFAAIPRPATKQEKVYSTHALSCAYYDPHHNQRGNVNVLGWGGLFGLDFDKGSPTIDEMEMILKAMGLKYALYTSTNCRPEKHKYRVFLPMSRFLTPEEIPFVWSSVFQMFGEFGDASCKDLSRILYAPADWQPAQGEDANDNPLVDLRYSLTGADLDVDQALIDFPPRDVHVAPMVPELTDMDRLRLALIDDKRPAVDRVVWSGVSDCPFVKEEFLKEYLSTKGDWRTRLFSLGKTITKSAAWFYVRGRADFDANDLTNLLIEIDQMDGGWYDHKDLTAWANKIIAQNWSSFVMEQEAKYEQEKAKKEVIEVIEEIKETPPKSVSEMPVDKLPSVIKDYLHGLYEEHGYPYELTAPSALAMANFAAQGHYDVDSILFGTIPLTEFFFVIAPSGCVKSSVFKKFTGGYTQWEDGARQVYENELEEYSIKKELYEEAKNAIRKIKDKCEKEEATRNLEKPEKPLNYNRVILKPTSKGLFNVLDETMPSIGLMNPEAGGFIKSYMFRDKNTTIEMGADLTYLWDGSPLRRSVGEDSREARGKRMCVFMAAQPNVCAEFVTNADLDEQGLLARFLINSSPDYEVPDLDLIGDGLGNPKLAKLALAFQKRIYDLLSKPLPTWDDKPGVLKPNVLSLTSEAKGVVTEWFNGKQVKHWHKTIYAGAGSLARRPLEHVLRLAGTCAVIDGKTEIDAPHIEAGIALIEYYLEQRLRLDLDDSGIDDRHKDERRTGEKLLGWMKEKGADAYTMRDFARAAPNAFRKLNATKQEMVIASMKAWGWIEDVEVIGANGRKSDGYKVVDFATTGTNTYNINGNKIVVK